MIVIEELFRGTTVTEAAEVIGVSRKTVSNWKNNVTEFRAELNRFRAEHQERVGDRLVSLLDLALDVVHARLEEQRDKDVALAILKGSGYLDGHQPRIGPTTEDGIRAEYRDQLILEGMGIGAIH